MEAKKFREGEILWIMQFFMFIFLSQFSFFKKFNNFIELYICVRCHNPFWNEAGNKQTTKKR